jgi:hypothetical protein
VVVSLILTKLDLVTYTPTTKICTLISVEWILSFWLLILMNLMLSTVMIVWTTSDSTSSASLVLHKIAEGIDFQVRNRTLFDWYDRGVTTYLLEQAS